MFLNTRYQTAPGPCIKTSSNESGTSLHLAARLTIGTLTTAQCYNVTCHQQYSSKESSCVKIEFSFLKFNNEIVKLDYLNRSSPCLLPYRFSTPTSISINPPFLLNFYIFQHRGARSRSPCCPLREGQCNQ